MSFASDQRKAAKQEIQRLQALVTRLEERYGVTSDELQAALADGVLRESPEVSRWLEALAALGEAGSASTPPAGGRPTVRVQFRNGIELPPRTRLD